MTGLFAKEVKYRSTLETGQIVLPEFRLSFTFDCKKAGFFMLFVGVS